MDSHNKCQLVQKEINNRTMDIELLRKNAEIDLGKINDNIDAVSANMEEKLAVHFINIKKEFTENEREIDQKNRALVEGINDHKMHTDASVEGIRQELVQTKEGVNSRVEGIASEVKTVSTAITADKQSILSEFQKVKIAISRIEAKITGCTTPLHSSIV
jgi:hypothetical protein